MLLPDVDLIYNLYSNKPSGKTLNINVGLSRTFGSSGLSVTAFENLAKLDAVVSADLIKDKFPLGVNIIDTADKIKSLITSSDSAIIPAKDYIKGISSTNDSEVIELSWDQYIGALSGVNFSKTNKSTWSNLTDEIAFKEIGNIQLVVSGKASEIQDIVDKYGNTLANFPSGITLKITDGNEISLKSAQLDVLDSRIEGKVKISDSTANIGTLLDSAVSNNIKSIETTGGSLEINFDQFRNLPKYYSADVVIKDTEKNIVDALNEDLLDDRVTTLVLTDQSKLIGTGVDDSALTLTAAAASNLLGKKVQSSSDYGSNSTYMPIKIVDRASAIANFIETATIPGAQTKLAKLEK